MNLSNLRLVLLFLAQKIRVSYAGECRRAAFHPDVCFVTYVAQLKALAARIQSLDRLLVANRTGGIMIANTRFDESKPGSMGINLFGNK